MIYIGIDPGRTGGMAAIFPSGKDGRARGKGVVDDDQYSYHFSRMPASEMEVWQWLSQDEFRPYNTELPAAVAVVENIVPGSFTGRDSGQSPANQAKLYGHFRMLCAFLTAAGIPYETVNSAKAWRACGIGPRKREWSKSQWKQHLRRRAVELFPELYITLDVADALLLAWYCRHVNEMSVRPGPVRHSKPDSTITAEEE